MRIALAGIGAAASNGHLPALLWLESEGRVKVVGACDPDEHRRVAARRLFPRIPTFASASEMLQSVNSELTVIAAHPAVHADLATDAANHHQHILCEKPAGGTPEQLSQLAAIRERHPDRALIASYQYRFSPTWIALTPFLRAAARSNKPVYMSVEVERCATDPRAMSSWRDDPAMGGGLADHAVHFLALARELGGSLIVETASRDYDHQRRERVTARVSVGLNPVDLSVSYGAAARSTTVKLRAGDLAVRWRDRELRVDQGRPAWASSSSSGAVGQVVRRRSLLPHVFRPSRRSGKS